MIQKSRISDERRNEVRYIAQIKIEWEGIAGKQSGMVSDISETGCFVLCSGAVADGEKVKLYFPTGGQQPFELSGEVTNHYDEIGYAVHFAETEEIERLFLKHLINTLPKANPIANRTIASLKMES